MRRETAELIAKAIHPARFATYLGEMDGHYVDAMRLYQWNVKLSGAWLECLSILEVVLRNALDRELRRWVQHEDDTSDGQWLLTGRPSPLDTVIQDRAIEKIRRGSTRAKSSRPSDHERRDAPLTHDDLLANMNFGTTAKLLPTDNTKNSTYGARRVLWEQATRHAFPGHDFESDPHGWRLAARVQHLKDLRNRAAHMEPLLRVSSKARLADLHAVLGSIDPTIRDWAAGLNRVTEIEGLDPRSSRRG